uniref:Uncharacterized protein n=1 Tax=Spongospora subterranea TaxID=70186 RepID=A0A0H5R5D2_9EUKA|eukprot:CRZ03364.1 hypothetical protein [Spongospora subterranea]
MANELLAFRMLLRAEESTPPPSPMICSFCHQCLFYTMQDEISGSSSWKCLRLGYKPFLELSSFLHRLNLRKEGSNVAYMILICCNQSDCSREHSLPQPQWLDEAKGKHTDNRKCQYQFSPL